MTDDFSTSERHGPIMSPEDKDVSDFPTSVRRLLSAHPSSGRPKRRPPANMWLSFSPDLHNRGDHNHPAEVATAPAGRRWAWSPPPIETAEGWLIVYHGVRSTPAGAIYRGGLALLDLEDPRRVLHRGEEWVIGPQAVYEVTGDIPHVVFPCGAIAHDGELRLYYGAADTSVGVMILALPADVPDWLRHQPSQTTAPAIESRFRVTTATIQPLEVAFIATCPPRQCGIATLPVT